MLTTHWIEITDSFQPRYVTRITFTIYKPSIRYPLPAILVFVTNGGGSVLFRFAKVEQLETVFPITPKMSESLANALAAANRIANRLETEEYEAVAEAERILQGGADGAE